MLALSVVVLFFASIVPGIELTVLAISGAIVMIIVSETNVKVSIVFYGAAVLLSFLIIPNKSILIIYAFIFGPYSIIKSVIEKYTNNRIVEYIAKILAFNALLGAGFLIFKEAFFTGIELPDLAWYLILAGAQVMFVLYDYILTLIIRIYDRIIPESVRGRRD